MSTLTVSKFGGTSMGDADCMRRSATVSTRQKAGIVVLSATSGTTNSLIALGQAAQTGRWPEAEGLMASIRIRHLKIADELKTPSAHRTSLESLLEEMESIGRGIYLLKDCSPKALDTLMSLGERMSSVLFVKAMQDALDAGDVKRTARWLDARDVIRTDDQFGKGRPLPKQIRKLAAENMADPKSEIVFVTQGFIGATNDGATTTLGRGGSDYSAALFAEAVNASTLEIWTDVAGIATTDPRICSAARPIDEISFTEASELATFGAKILHPATLLPAIRRNIPVFVGSSFDSEQKGTWVRREVSSAPLIRALALRKKQVLLTLSTPEMLHTHGFLAKIFRVIDDNKISVDAITTSEICVSFTLDDAAALNKKLLAELSAFADVQVEEGLTLISLIGNNINHTPGLARRIFETIPDINVRMICLGASKHNFCFLVSEDKAEDAIRRMHRAFVES